MAPERTSVSSMRTRVSTGYGRLDKALGGGFLTGSAVLVSAPAGDEVMLLVANFLKASRSNENCLFICGRSSSVDAVSIPDISNVTFLVCGERAASSERVMSAQSLDNLTELSMNISDAVNKIQPKRIAIEILSDILLRHGPLQTRKWLSGQVSKLRLKDITTIAFINPAMHSQSDTAAIADIFDGNLETVDIATDKESMKILRIKWMHGIEVLERDIPLGLISAAPKSQLPPPNNLPTQPTPIIGREGELAKASTLLLREETQLLTLTGPGGAGKTRLAVELARTMAESFKDGIFFVALAPIADASMVLAAISRTLRVNEEPGRPMIETLKDYLRDKQFLLVLDNFEHVITASPDVADLLAACPSVKILVTSRAALRIRNEREFPVPPLAVPDIKQLPNLEEIIEYAGVKLFAERAHAVRPDFEVTNENARAVSEICVRLDGLPLALELAAARIRILSPVSMLRRLETSLDLLTLGARDLPARQQTLRNTIAWSYNLLNDHEKELFQRLSVFVGGFTLEAAESVCKLPSNSDFFVNLESLVQRNLLKRIDSDDESRFGFLETVREYAMESLVGSGKSQTVHQNHVDFYLSLVERAEPELKGPQQGAWLDQLERENDNLRAALGWLIESEESEQALRLAGALWRFWLERGYLSEGRQWLARVLTLSGSSSDLARSKALRGAGAIADVQGNLVAAQTLLEESLRISLRIDDKHGIAQSLNNLGLLAFELGNYVLAQDIHEQCLRVRRELGDENGVAASLNNLGLIADMQGDYDTARVAFNEALVVSGKLGDKRVMALSLNNLGFTTLRGGDPARARPFLEKSLVINQELKDKMGTSLSLNNLGYVALKEGKLATARKLLDQGLVLCRELEDRGGVAWSVTNQGYASLKEGKLARARTLFEEGLLISKELDDKEAVAYSLEGLARLTTVEKEAERAAHLFGAANSIRKSINAPLPLVEHVDHESSLIAARVALGGESFEQEYGRGNALTLDQAIAYALRRSSEGSEVSLPPRKAHLKESAMVKMEILQIPGTNKRYSVQQTFSGGMGVVHKVQDVDYPEQIMAAKTYRLSESKAADIFNREAINWLNLGVHPNIVQVYFVTNINDKSYVFCEYVEGKNLRQVISSETITFARGLLIIQQICQAIHHAHRVGLVHRDLKPENVLIRTDGVVKVTDFGIAKAIIRDEQLTETLELKGTVPYMAPELFSGGSRRDFRVDIYALGVMMYELLTGKRPPECEDLGRKVAKDTVILPPSRIDSSIPKEADRIILKCLAVDPDDRYSDILEIRQDLNQLESNISGST